MGDVPARILKQEEINRKKALDPLSDIKDAAAKKLADAAIVGYNSSTGELNVPPAPGAQPTPSVTPAPAAPAPAPAPSGQVTKSPSQPAPAPVQTISDEGLPDLTTLFDKLNEPPDPKHANDPDAGLASKIYEYLDTLQRRPAPHLPMSTGEVMALGLLGGLDKDAFEKVVLPTIAYERDVPRQALQDQQHQMGLQVQALESLAKLRETAQEHREMMEFHKGDLALQVAQLRKGVSQFNATQTNEAAQARSAQEGAMARTQAEIAGRFALKRLADDKDKQDIRNSRLIINQTQQALAFMDAHPGKVSYSPEILRKVDPALAAFDALIGDLRTSFVTGRGGKRITEPELKLFGGTIPQRGTFKSETEIRAALQQIQAWAMQKKELIEGDFGAPIESIYQTQVLGRAPEAAGVLVSPTLLPGDSRTGVHLPDDDPLLMAR